MTSSVLRGVPYHERAAEAASLFADLVKELVPQGRAAFAGVKLKDTGEVRLLTVKGIVDGRLQAVDMAESTRLALCDLDDVRDWSFSTPAGTIDVDHLLVLTKLRAR